MISLLMGYYCLDRELRLEENRRRVVSCFGGPSIPGGMHHRYVDDDFLTFWGRFLLR